MHSHNIHIYMYILCFISICLTLDYIACTTGSGSINLRKTRPRLLCLVLSGGCAGEVLLLRNPATGPRLSAFGSRTRTRQARIGFRVLGCFGKLLCQKTMLDLGGRNDQAAGWKVPG